MTTPPKTLKSFLWHFVWQQKWGFLFYFIFSLAWGLEHALWPIYFKYFINAINSTHNTFNIFSELTPILWTGIALRFILEIMFRTQGLISVKILPRLGASIQKTMFEYAGDHSYRYFSDNFAGSISSKVFDMSRFAVDTLNVIFNVLPSVILGFIISFAIMLNVHPLFAGAFSLWFLLHIFICLIASKGISNYSRKEAKIRGELKGKVADSFSNFLTVSLFARKKQEKQYIGELRNREEKADHTTRLYTEKSRFFLGLNEIFAFIAIGYLIIKEWQLGKINNGDVVFILTAAWNIMGIAWQVGQQVLPNLYRNIGICRQELSLIQEPIEINDAPDAKELVIQNGEIAFENVDFSYKQVIEVFHNHSINIKAGEKVALVGFSGGGKTTLVNLILRFFDVNSGKIIIDGQDIKTVTQDSLRSQIAMIPQDTNLFHRTIKENIRYGRIDATDEEIIEAAKKSHCHEFISKLEYGYDSMVGERGIKLSGGQRQRIAIARAMLKNAKILILDEATSSLDSITEKYIKDSLLQLMQGKTTIVIAHRLSTLLDMERILVFQDGKITEQGSHAELLALGGHYAKLWNMQAGGFLPEKEENTDII